MLSKVTSGVPLATTKAAASDAAAAAVVAQQVKHGAMGASGIPRPDKATVDALVAALATTATGAGQWHVSESAPVVTASVAREVTGTRAAGEIGTYRLTLSCNAETHERAMQLAWAPQATSGVLTATVDGGAPFTYNADGAAIELSRNSRMALPNATLHLSGLFPNESVDFPVGDLPAPARQSLAACWQ
jgi:hypothetical protein